MACAYSVARTQLLPHSHFLEPRKLGGPFEFHEGEGAPWGPLSCVPKSGSGMSEQMQIRGHNLSHLCAIKPTTRNSHLPKDSVG